MAPDVTIDGQSNVQCVLVSTLLQREHRVVLKGADARERPACDPRRTRLGRQVVRRVPPDANAIEIAVAPGEPEICLAPPRVPQLTPRRDAAEPTNDGIEP